MDRKRRIAALIPAHNEEKVLRATIESLKGILPVGDIYIVSDGSTDNTVKVAKFPPPQKIFKNGKALKSSNKTYDRPQVLILKKNQGKAKALNLTISSFELCKRYEYLMFIDADTLVTKSYLNKVIPIFKADTNKEIACVVGKVEGQNQGWLSAYRTWEYEISQAIHKNAQSRLGAIIVSPGCATVCRADIFNKIQFPTGTLTEDMDLTFRVHRDKLGKIVFSKEAVVITQDPRRLKDLLRQIDRWYTGFWQCVFKHKIPWGGQLLDLEVTLMATEALFNGLLVIALLGILPFLTLDRIQLFILAFFVDFFLFMLPSLIYVAARYKNMKFIIYVPLYYLVRVLSSMVFLKSFIFVTFNLDSRIKWKRATRYSFIKEALWSSQFQHPTVFR